MSIGKSQYNEIAKGSKNISGDLEFGNVNVVDLSDVTLSFFQRYSAIYVKAIEESITKHKLVGSTSKLLEGVDPEVSKDGNTLRIYMANYYDFVNKGVKGVKGSKNAPNSPYQYKTYRMSEKGRKSIKEYINQGKAKIQVATKKSTVNAVGLEKKKVSLLDLKTDALIYLIKKWGIKTTNFFDEATESVEKAMIEDLGEVMAQTIVIQIGNPKKK
jgi:hypothetical protein